jgi:hypothetical protein
MNLDKNLKNLILLIIRDLFLAAFVLLIVFTFLEIVKPKIILNYLNLDIFLLVVLILGIITILYYEPAEKAGQKLKFLDYSTICLFSILVGILCLYLTRAIGLLSILVGIVSAVICFNLILNSES